MKITFIYHDFPGLGGIETVTLLLANYLCDQEFDISIISSYAIPKYDYDKINPKIKLIETPVIKNLNHPTNISFIENFITENMINIVINQGMASKINKSKLPKETCLIQTLHGLPFWEIRDIPYSVTVEDLKKASVFKKTSVFKKIILNHIYPQRRYRRIYDYYQYFLDNSDIYITLCKGLENIILEKFPAYQSKLLSIENPINELQNTNLSNKKNEIVFVGRLNYSEKRVDRVLKIWSQIEQKGTDWKLRIIGDGPYKENLITLAKKLNLQKCHFEGYHTNPEKFQRDAKIILLTSNFEGIPMSLIEAMQLGTVPVVYNCSPGIEFIIKNNINGILIDCFDEADFVKQLYKIMNDSRLLQTLSKNGIEAMRKFNIDKIGRIWMHLFYKINASQTIIKHKKTQTPQE